MAEIFDKFPLIRYNINLEDNGIGQTFEYPVNILTRIGFIAGTLSNIFMYYDYTIKETDKPEILAEKYYGDAEAYWVILLANKRLDPFYDWPLNTKNFNSYVSSKYGDIPTAKTTIIKYQKLIKTVDVSTNTETINSYEITESEYNTLPEEDLNPVQKILSNGKAVYIYEYRNSIYAYDYEFDLNESKRNIKLIKKEYYPTIKREFESLLNSSSGINNRMRTL